MTADLVSAYDSDDTDADLQAFASTNYKDPPSLASSGANLQTAANDPNYQKTSEDTPTDDDPTGAGQDPRGGSGEPEKEDYIERMERQLDPLRKQQKELQGKAEKAQQAALDQEEASIKRFEARTANRPTPKSLPESPQAFSQEAVNYLQITALVGAIAGTLTRGNTTAGLNAFSGAVQGFMKGNQQVFEAKTQEWKMISQRIKEDNQAQMDAYDQVLKDENMDATMKQRHIQNIAKMYDNQMVWNQAAQDDITKTGLLIEKQRQWEQNRQDADTKMHWYVEKAKAEIEKSRNPSIGRGAENDVYQRELKSFEATHGHPADGKEAGQILQEVKSGVRGAAAVGTRAAGVETVIATLKYQIPDAIKLSNEVKGKQVHFAPLSLDVNQAKLWVRQHNSDPKVVEFLIAHYNLAETWATLMNQGRAPRISDREYALQELNQAYAAKAYAAGANRVWTNAQNEKKGIAELMRGGVFKEDEDTSGAQPPAGNDNSGWQNFKKQAQ